MDLDAKKWPDAQADDANVSYKVTLTSITKLTYTLEKIMLIHEMWNSQLYFRLLVIGSFMMSLPMGLINTIDEDCFVLIMNITLTRFFVICILI